MLNWTYILAPRTIFFVIYSSIKNSHQNYVHSTQLLPVKTYFWCQKACVIIWWLLLAGLEAFFSGAQSECQSSIFKKKLYAYIAEGFLLVGLVWCLCRHMVAQWMTGKCAAIGFCTLIVEMRWDDLAWQPTWQQKSLITLWYPRKTLKRKTKFFLTGGKQNLMQVGQKG